MANKEKEGVRDMYVYTIAIDNTIYNDPIAFDIVSRFYTESLGGNTLQCFSTDSEPITKSHLSEFRERGVKNLMVWVLDGVNIVNSELHENSNKVVYGNPCTLLKNRYLDLDIHEDNIIGKLFDIYRVDPNVLTRGNEDSFTNVLRGILSKPIKSVPDIDDMDFLKDIDRILSLSPYVQFSSIMENGGVYNG